MQIPYLLSRDLKWYMDKSLTQLIYKAPSKYSVIAMTVQKIACPRKKLWLRRAPIVLKPVRHKMKDRNQKTTTNPMKSTTYKRCLKTSI